MLTVNTPPPLLQTSRGKGHGFGLGLDISGRQHNYKNENHKESDKLQIHSTRALPQMQIQIQGESDKRAATGESSSLVTIIEPKSVFPHLEFDPPTDDEIICLMNFRAGLPSISALPLGFLFFVFFCLFRH